MGPRFFRGDLFVAGRAFPFQSGSGGGSYFRYDFRVSLRDPRDRLHSLHGRVHYPSVSPQGKTSTMHLYVLYLCSTVLYVRGVNVSRVIPRALLSGEFGAQDYQLFVSSLYVVLRTQYGVVFFTGLWVFLYRRFRQGRTAHFFRVSSTKAGSFTRLYHGFAHLSFFRATSR